MQCHIVCSEKLKQTKIPQLGKKKLKTAREVASIFP